MISRRRCQEIAKAWVHAQGVAEYERRADSIYRLDEEAAQSARKIGQPFEVDAGHRLQLARDMHEALVVGFYDPPMPKIPGFFARLRMKDWTPPMPTSEGWPMGTGGVSDEG